MQLELSVIIVTFNSQDYIKECIESIKKQDYKPFEMILIDNNSKDNTLKVIKRYPFIKVLRNKKNFGFSKANNQGIKIANGRYILLLNPDVILTKGCIHYLVKKLANNPKMGFVIPKLLKSWNRNIIDSTGIKPTTSRRFYDIGLMETDSRQYDSQTNVFAGTGAALMFKRTALEDVKLCGEYFDEDFFCYKEDIDLCWRAKLKGWRGLYVPEAVAYHERGHDLERFRSLFTFLKKRIKQRNKESDYKSIRRWSFRNNIFLTLKNDSLRYLIADAPFILSFWIPALAYYLIFEPYVYSEIPRIIRLIPKILNKRKIIQQNRKISHKILRVYFK